MVNVCCVPECKTGYKSCKTQEKIALFRFPKQEELQQRWLKAIPRQNWNSSHRVCAKHFHEDDIQRVSIDTRGRTLHELKCPHLKPTATPMIFSKLPNYLSKPLPVPRPTSASTASSRHDAESIRIERQNQELLRQDIFDDFESFKIKLKDMVLPDGYVTVLGEKVVQFHYIQCNDDPTAAPKLLVSATLTDNLVFKAYVSSVLQIYINIS